MVTTKTKNKKNGIVVVYLTQWLARFTASSPTGANLTDLYEAIDM